MLMLRIKVIALRTLESNYIDGPCVVIYNHLFYYHNLKREIHMSSAINNSI